MSRLSGLVQPSTQNKSESNSGFTATTHHTAASSSSAGTTNQPIVVRAEAAHAPIASHSGALLENRQAQQQLHLAASRTASAQHNNWGPSHPQPPQHLPPQGSGAVFHGSAGAAAAAPAMPRTAGETDSGFWIPHSANNSGFIAPGFMPGPSSGSGFTEPSRVANGGGGGSGMSAPGHPAFAPGAAPYSAAPTGQLVLYSQAMHGVPAGHHMFAPPPSTAPHQAATHVQHPARAPVASPQQWSPMFDAPQVVTASVPPQPQHMQAGGMFSQPPPAPVSAPPQTYSQGGPAGAESLQTSHDDETKANRVIMFCNSAGRSVRDIFDDAGMVVRQEIVDVYIQRGAHPPTVRQVTIVQPRGGDAKIKAAYFARRITYTFPAADRDVRKVTQSRRDAEVVRVKKHFLRKYLAEVQAASDLGGGTLAQGQVNWAQREERASSLAVARANLRARGHTLDGTEAFGTVVHDSTAFHYHEAAYELDTDLAGVGLPQLGGGATEAEAEPTTASAAVPGGSVVGGAASGEGSRSRPARNLPPNAKDVLSGWLMSHIAHPYPTEAQKDALQQKAHISRKQLNNWFTNARKRMLGKGGKGGHAHESPLAPSVSSGRGSVPSMDMPPAVTTAEAQMADTPAAVTSSGMSALLMAASSVGGNAQGQMPPPSGSQQAPLSIPPMAAPTGATNVSFPGGMPPVQDSTRSLLRVRLTRDRSAGASSSALRLLGVTGPMHFDQNTAPSVGILPTSMLEEDECETRPVPPRQLQGGARGSDESGQQLPKAAPQNAAAVSASASKGARGSSETASGQFGASFHSFSERSGSGSGNGSGNGGGRAHIQRDGVAASRSTSASNSKGGSGSGSGSASNSRDGHEQGSRSGSAGSSSPPHGGGDGGGAGNVEATAPSGSSGADGDVSDQGTPHGGGMPATRGRRRGHKRPRSSSKGKEGGGSDGGSSQWSVSQTAESSSGSEAGASPQDTPQADAPPALKRRAAT